MPCFVNFLSQFDFPILTHSAFTLVSLDLGFELNGVHFCSLRMLSIFGLSFLPGFVHVALGFMML